MVAVAGAAKAPAQHSGDFPLKGTKAQRMLADALESAWKDKDQSQRYIAAQLGYKSSVVVSHMALGRVPIPVDRAIDFARYLGMDQNEFLLAVLEQRHPDIDFNRLLTKGKAAARGKVESSALATELEATAGKPLDELNIGQVKVMREVVQDPTAPRRWVASHEIGLIEQIRRLKPDGLTPAENNKLLECLQG